MTGETQKIAEYVASSSHESLERQGVREATREALLDWIGCAMAGSRDPRVQPLYKMLEGQRPDGASVLVGRGERCNPVLASLLNGAAAHVLELDDVESEAFLHPGVSVIAAALSALPLGRDLTQDRVLRAIAAGYEVGIRVGRAANPSHYLFWHTTGTAGSFAAAAAAAVVLGLTPEETAWALGNAGTEAAGLWQFNNDGAMTKPYHAGMAALHGLVAAMAAKEGLTGSRTILEGKQGFLAAMSKEQKLDRLTGGLGVDSPAILRISRKKWASCRFTHAPIDAVLKAKKEKGNVSIKKMVVETTDTAIRVAGIQDPRTPQEAKFSIRYCCALAWVSGRVGIDGFEASSLRANPALESVLGRIEVKEDPSLAAKTGLMPARLIVFWDGGPESTYEVWHAEGDPESPITGAALDEKVSDLLAHAKLSGPAISQLLSAVRNFGGSASPDELVRML